jgi:hypothetical protein
MATAQIATVRSSEVRLSEVRLSEVRPPASIVLRIAAWAAVCGVGLTGCASPGGGASTHNDVGRCAAVLPTARDLMHGQGRLALVRPLKQADADIIVRDAGQPAASAPASSAPASSAPAPSAPSPAPSAPGTLASTAPSGTPRGPQAAHPQAAHPQGAHPQAGHPQAAHPLGSQHPGTPARPKLCLVVYQGSFRADAISGAQPPTATGKYALIFLRVRHPAVDRILITDVLPASTHRPWWHF